MPSAKAWVQMVVVGVGLCVGGPALVYYVTPTEEEIFKRYNPELQKRSLENRNKTQEDFAQFVGQLKEYSKSDKPIWAAQKEAEANSLQAKRERLQAQQAAFAAETERRRQEIRSQSQA